MHGHCSSPQLVYLDTSVAEAATSDPNKLVAFRNSIKQVERGRGNKKEKEKSKRVYPQISKHKQKQKQTIPILKKQKRASSF